jgi:hypothetical protein
LIPSIGAQAFGGGLGGGRNGSSGHFGEQEDYFVGIGWRIGPGGLFDSGRQQTAMARLNAAGNKGLHGHGPFQKGQKTAAGERFDA